MIIRSKFKPTDFRPIKENPKVGRAVKVLEKTREHGLSAERAVAEAEKCVAKSREGAVDALLDDAEPDRGAIAAAEKALADAVAAKKMAYQAREKAQARVGEATNAARAELVDKLKKATFAAAGELKKKLIAALAANEAVISVWRRASELGVHVDVPHLGFVGRLNEDCFQIWQSELAGYTTKKPHKPAPGIVVIRFTSSPPRHLLPLVSANFYPDEVAGFEKSTANRLVREGFAVYHDDADRQPPPPPKPKPIDVPPGESVVVQFKRKWFAGEIGSLQRFMTDDVTRLDASIASVLIHAGIAVMVADPVADDLAPAAPAPTPAPIEGKTDAPRLKTRGAAR